MGRVGGGGGGWGVGLYASRTINMYFYNILNLGLRVVSVK